MSSYASVLKSFADEKGLEYEKNYSVKKMIALIQEAGFELPERDEVAPVEPAPKASSKGIKKELRELEELIRDKSPVGEKRAKTAIGILKKETESDPAKRIELLRFLDSRDLLNVADEYELNAICAREAKGQCLHVNKTVSGHFLEIGKEYPFDKYFDETRKAYIFKVYVDVTKEPEDQITREAARKMSLGFQLTESDYLAPKVLWRKTTLVESEFRKYFEILDEAE